MPKIIKIEELKDVEIENILKTNLGIIEQRYLKRIADLACGNIRVAMLAGIGLINNNLDTLESATDVFVRYYGSIVTETSITKEDLLFLCIIAISGPVRIKRNVLYIELINNVLPNSNIDTLIGKLYNLELIDWFKDEIVNVSDQSFGDYILYYVIYEKKLVLLCDLIKRYFPKFREKIMYVINTLVKKFFSQSMQVFIKANISEAWEVTDKKDALLYLESFYRVNPLKSLLILKKIIEDTEYIEYKLTIDYIEKNKNNNIIPNMTIRILSGYKYSDYYEEAIDLLLIFLHKRLDLFIEFYYVIIKNMLYDENSYDNNYTKENLFLNKLWSSCEDGNNIELSLLYIFIVERALETEFHFVEDGRNYKNIVFCTSTLALTYEMRQLRSEIWRNLFILRRDCKFRKKVDEILTVRHINGLPEDVTKDFINFDFDIIYTYIKDDIDYFAAKTIGLYKKDAKSLNMCIDNRMLRAEENEYYRLCHLLTKNHLIGRTIEEDERIRKNAIFEEIVNYTNNDFHNLFSACKYICKVESNSFYGLDSGIRCIFSLYENDKEKYTGLLKLFFSDGAPAISYSRKHIIQYMLTQYGYVYIMNLINRYDFESKNIWLFDIWECLPEKCITIEIARDFNKFIGDNDIIVPNLWTLYNYAKYDKDIVDNVINKLHGCPEKIISFFNGFVNDDFIPILFELFDGKIDALYNIYLDSLETDIDYEGKLFYALYELKPEIWNEYIDFLKNNKRLEISNQHIFDKIWEKPEYKAKIKIAFESLIDELFLYNSMDANLIFHKSSDEDINKKKKEWLLEQLYITTNDINRVQRLVNIVSIVFPEWEVEYLLEFLKHNNSISDFQELFLFPLTCSWSGSEIPIILKKLKILEDLKNSIRGVDLIDHRMYINTQIDKLEKYKDEVELKEYLENV